MHFFKLNLQVPAGGPFPAPMGNVLTQQPFPPVFSQVPTPFATSTAFSDEDIRKHQEEIYIAGSLYVEWLRVRILLPFNFDYPDLL